MNHYAGEIYESSSSKSSSVVAVVGTSKWESRSENIKWIAEFSQHRGYTEGEPLNRTDKGLFIGSFPYI
jgi:hypothetical protein